MTPAYTILVCGSRDWTDLGRIQSMLKWRRDYMEFHGVGPGRVIHGDADGADRMGALAAASLGFTVEAFRADWRKHGRAAGPIRNQRMLDEGRPNVVFAFSLVDARGDLTVGTADMVRRAIAAGVVTTIVAARRAP